LTGLSDERGSSSLISRKNDSPGRTGDTVEFLREGSPFSAAIREKLVLAKECNASDSEYGEFARRNIAEQE
jgi:hypothetical protein